MRNNRKIDIYPYTRENAEAAIMQAKKTLDTFVNFERLMGSFQKTGKDDRFEGLGFELMVGSFVEDIDDLIASTFPELMPIDWAEYPASFSEYKDNIQSARSAAVSWNGATS